MRKRILAAILAALLLFASALAESSPPKLSDDLFAQAKEALSRLSYGEYAQISGLLSWSSSAPETSFWEGLAGKFRTLNNGTVQRDVAVGWWAGSAWYIAVPLAEPNSEQVEAMVFASSDGQRFSGAAKSLWGDVRDAYESSDFVRWNVEYVAGTPVIENDD